MARFELDAEQTDAILELKIYRLARLEILIIRKELEEKRKRARQISALLKRRGEPLEARARRSSRRSSRQYGDKRRTVIASDGGEPEYTADDFIVEEDNVVIVSRDGWVKRQKEIKDLVDDAAARRRRGAGGRAPAARARACVFFSNFGVAYTCADHRRAGVDRLRRADSEAVQAEGRRADRRGAQPRSARGRRHRARRRTGDAAAGARRRVTSDGYALRFGLEAFVEPSTRAGRRFARPSEGAEVVGVARLTGGEILIAATAEARGILCKADEVNFLSGPGKGVHPDQARTTTTACSASSRRPATAIC